MAEKRAEEIERELGPSSLDEVIPPTGNAGLATGNHSHSFDEVYVSTFVIDGF